MKKRKRWRELSLKILAQCDKFNVSLRVIATSRDLGNPAVDVAHLLCVGDRSFTIDDGELREREQRRRKFAECFTDIEYQEIEEVVRERWPGLSKYKSVEQVLISRMNCHAIRNVKAASEAANMNYID